MFRMMERMARKARTPLHPTMIRAWREYRGLSQDKLVERVREWLPGFSKTSLSRLENGKQPYTQRTLEAIGLALEAQAGDLIMRDPTNPVWSIMDALNKLPHEQQNQVAEIVKTFRAA